MIRSIGILMLASMTSAQQPTPTDAQRRQAMYAVYSAMMSYPPTSNENEMYVIADTTKLAWPSQEVLTAGNNPYPCIVPPPEYASRWSEVLADFKARKDTPSTLERALNIPKPYVYIKLEEAAVFSAPDARYPGAKEAFTLSDVYFNRDRTLALTGISARWKIYEKASGGAWKEVRPERNCYRVA